MEKKEILELRQDPVSHDWIIISTGRAKRPEVFKSRGLVSSEIPVSMCPFESPQEHGNEIVKIYAGGIKVINNKFPIVRGDICNLEKRVGPYLVKEAAGYHEVVIFKDHDKSIAQLNVDEVGQVVSVYCERYQELKNKECVEYILIMHNHGSDVGASIYHPHSQIIALPFVPADISRSLGGSARYYKECGRCVHCDMVEWELNQKKRIIFENRNFVAFVPYAPRFSYEIRIFPKVHQPYFEESDKSDLNGLAEALRTSLAKVYNGLKGSAYNFFIHTSPVSREEYSDYYHWHLEISPRLSTWSGFELGTGGEVIDTDPNEAAEYLRKISNS